MTSYEKQRKKKRLHQVPTSYWRGPHQADGLRMTQDQTGGSLKPLHEQKQNPGSTRVICVFKVRLSRKPRAPIRCTKLKHPYLIYSIHSLTQELYFRAGLGLSGSNKMLSVLRHRRDQNGGKTGGAAPSLGTIV